MAGPAVGSGDDERSNGVVVPVRRSARDRRAPQRYEPQEHPLDDFSESEDDGGSGSDSEQEEGEVDGSDGDSDSGSDTDTVGSLRDFVVPDDGEDDSDGDTHMLSESDLEGYTTTDDDEMDWSPGESEDGGDESSDEI